MSPKQFYERMLEIPKKYYYDDEATHMYMDELMCELLAELGYGDGVKVFEETQKWYS